MQRHVIFASAFAACIIATPAVAIITCTISMTDLPFGSINVLLGSAVDSTGTITISCSGATANTTYRFCTDIRGGPDELNNLQRRMISGANYLNFDLYKDAGRTVQWGDYVTPDLGGGSQNDFTSNGAGNISATLPVYGRVAGSQQSAIPGSYAEVMSPHPNGALHYGATPAAGNCLVQTQTPVQYSFIVSATVLTSCSVSATDVNFGSTSA
jgi:spore coat protein U-like protein